MANPTYDPYYLPHHHHHHHHRNDHRQPPPEFPHHHQTTNAFIYNNNQQISAISAANLGTHNNIPKEQRHINTLFVSGLPDDVLPREIHNIFRRRPGFDSCQLKFTGRRNQVVAFVTFFNHQSAVLALQALDGIQFDPQDRSVLHIELARSNSRRKRKLGSGPYVVIDKRRKAAKVADEISSEDDASDNGSNNSSQSGDLNSSNDDADSDEKSDVKKSDLNDPEAAVNKQKEKISDGDLQPCSTLFIANLGPKCSEEELRQALSQHPGFNGLKMRSRGGMPIAFADYEEVEQATNAMQAIQDSTLPSSDRGGMLIEYARSKMRKL